MDKRIEKYCNVINVLLETKLYDKIFVDHYHQLSRDNVIIKESGLYLERAEEGNLTSLRKKIADVTAVIDDKCDIVIEECWTRSDINSIRNAKDNILKCKWLRIHEFGWYRLTSPYLFILKSGDIKDYEIITPSTKPVPIDMWKIVECYIDDFEDRYKEYYLKDKHPNHY